MIPLAPALQVAGLIPHSGARAKDGRAPRLVTRAGAGRPESGSDQAFPRRPNHTAYRCSLPGLTGFRRRPSHGTRPSTPGHQGPNTGHPCL